MQLKKKLLLGLFVTLCLTSYAQVESQAKGLRFGMQLTPTISWFTTDETSLVDPQGSIVGYSFGVVGDWFFKENYALASGFFMNSMGGKMNYDSSMPIKTKNSGDEYPDGEVTLKPTYLEIPIGFKFLTKEFWRMKFVGQAGYNQFILLNATIRQEGGTLDKKDVKDEFTSMMSAYHFGFGTEYSLGGNAYLTASILATMGLNDVTKSKSDSGIDPVNKLNSINFKLGVIF